MCPPLTQIQARDKPANITAPTNVLGTAPGNWKWS